MVDKLREKIAGEITLSNDPGRTMRKWREEFGFSQLQIAEEMEISHSVISDYESGRRKSPGVGVIKRFVEALIELDAEIGSPTVSKYVPDAKKEYILAMDEFDQGVSIEDMIAAVDGVNLNPDPLPNKKILGYTIVDSPKAIVSMSSEDYLRIYGWTTERALIFTDVHYGRSPMVAIRAHPLTPAMVIYQKPDNTDPLAIKLSKLEGVPLVTTELSVEELVIRFNAMKEGI